MKPNFVKSKGKRCKTHCNGSKSDIEQVGPVKDTRWIRECQDYSWKYINTVCIKNWYEASIEASIIRERFTMCS